MKYQTSWYPTKSLLSKKCYTCGNRIGMLKSCYSRRTMNYLFIGMCETSKVWMCENCYMLEML